MDGDCLYYEIRMIPAFVDGLTWHTNWESIDEIAQEGVGAALGGVYGLYYFNKSVSSFLCFYLLLCDVFGHLLRVYEGKFDT